MSIKEFNKLPIGTVIIGLSAWKKLGGLKVVCVDSLKTEWSVGETTEFHERFFPKEYKIALPFNKYYETTRTIQ